MATEPLNPEVSLGMDKLKQVLAAKFESLAPEMQKYLKDRRKLIGDKFYDNNTSRADKEKIFDELTELCKYFNHKLPFLKGQQRPPVSIETKRKEAEEFVSFCNSKQVYPSSEAIATVWVNTR